MVVHTWVETYNKEYTAIYPSDKNGVVKSFEPIVKVPENRFIEFVNKYSIKSKPIVQQIKEQDVEKTNTPAKSISKDTQFSKRVRKESEPDKSST